MQDLLRKKNDLIKKKKTLLGIFFVNLSIIVILIINLFPLSNVYLKASLVGILSILEGVVSKKLKFTKKDIKRISNKINSLRELEIINNNEQEVELEKVNDIECNVDKVILDNDVKEKNNIKVKKKIL